MAVLGWPNMAGVDENQRLTRIAIWIGVAFVSILVHELGHAVIMRRFGSNARIVLHSFGGLAIPEGSLGFGRSYHRRSSNEQIYISLAGPFAAIRNRDLTGLAIDHKTSVGVVEEGKGATTEDLGGIPL